MGSAFDDALEYRALIAAAHTYALSHGRPGTPAYSAARRRFRLQVRTPEELRAWRQLPRFLSHDCVRVLNRAIERAMEIDGAPMANAQILDAEHETLRIVAQAGLSPQFIDFFERVDHDSQASCGEALAKNRPLWVEDAVNSPIFAGSQALEVLLDTGSRRCASVPVRAPNGKVIAMINTHHDRAAHWTDYQKRGLEALAHTTGRLLHTLLPAVNGDPIPTA